jgi:hypothetical protein
MFIKKSKEPLSKVKALQLTDNGFVDICHTELQRRKK